MLSQVISMPCSSVLQTCRRQHTVMPTAAEAQLMIVNQPELTSTENSGLSYCANLAFILSSTCPVEISPNCMCLLIGFLDAGGGTVCKIDVMHC